MYVWKYACVQIRGWVYETVKGRNCTRVGDGYLGMQQFEK